MKIIVTAEDIANGKSGPSAPRACPIALAMKRAGYPRAQVYNAYAYLHDDGVRCSLPIVAAVFIEEFDHGQPVQPFEFDLAVPP